MSKINWFFGQEAPPDEESPNESVTISADQLVIYGREVAELQRILTKRNATIGRLRAANRELRRELRARDRFGPPSISSSVVYAQAPPSHAEYDRKVVQIDPVEPTPLPTVPPRVGGVYRTRNGREIEITLRRNCGSFPFVAIRRDTGDTVSFRACGGYALSYASPFDLVAEISPPPEPAFTGPLEVGGWYEDQDGHTWQCQSIRIDFDSAILATCCRNYDRLIRDFHLDGSHVGKQLKLIRKVDPPGVES